MTRTGWTTATAGRHGGYGIMPIRFMLVRLTPKETDTHYI